MFIFRKVIYSCFVGIVIFAAALYGQAPNQTPGAAQMFHRYPADSIQCVAGDYIVTQSTRGWTVYLVHDLFFMSRLVPIKDTQGLTVVEQISIADSATPPKWHEIQLLVSKYKRSFPSRDEATAAIKADDLGESINGLVRSIKEFKKDTSFVYRK